MKSHSHVAIVTGANHGIGAAVAQSLACDGVSVLCTYLRVDDLVDPGIPEAYRNNRRGSANEVVEGILAAGGKAIAVEADLSDPNVPRQLFDTAEAELGPVDILVNNATGWVQDTFVPREHDRFGRRLAPVVGRQVVCTGRRRPG